MNLKNRALGAAGVAVGAILYPWGTRLGFAWAKARR